MKDFINPINDKDVQRIYNLLDSDISYEQVRVYGHYRNYLINKYSDLPFPKAKAENVLLNKIYDDHLTNVQNMFCDEYTQFYTLGQFQKMYFKAIGQFISNKNEELNVLDEYIGLWQGDNE